MNVNTKSLETVKPWVITSNICNLVTSFYTLLVQR